MTHYFLFLATLLCSSFAFSNAFASPATTPNDHLHGLNNCTQCHLDGVDIKHILLNDPSCSSCHTPETLATYVTKLLRGDYASKKQIPSTNEVVQSGSHYYEESKIGTQPNKMRKVDAGEFTMGSNERLSDEGPQHTVSLAAFFIDEYEVTNGQYKIFIDATKRRSPSLYRNRTYPHGKVDHPVVFVNWEDANDYCHWVDKRLPTDQEWEKAARGTDARRYPWGNEFSLDAANTPLRWASFNKFGDTTPVGAFKKGMSPNQLHDMSGNVWEWTSSWYKAYPGNQTFSENYGERYKTLKGGSWFDCSFYQCGISAPTYNRAFFAKKVKNDTFGFRCAKDI